MASEHGVWFGSSLLGREEQLTSECLAFADAPASVPPQTSEMHRLRALLDAILSDAVRLGVKLPRALLLQEGQVFYSGGSPVEVRLRGWEDWRPVSFEEGFVRAQGKPWKVGGACQLQRQRDQLRLGPAVRGLHHRSLSVVRDLRGISLVGAWSLQPAAQAPQLSLGFEAPSGSALSSSSGQASAELYKGSPGQSTTEAQGPLKAVGGE